MPDNKLDLIRSFLLKLKPKITEPQAYQSLVYTLGLINKKLLQAGAPLKNIAVIGPTQTGKSTLVNLLSGTSLAQVSELAAFTRKADGFVANIEPEEIKSYFDHLFSLDDARLEVAKWQIQKNPKIKLQNTVFWDSADFDSVEALFYKESTLILSAMADIVVMVLSKEKYSDLAVWRILDLLKFSSRPLLIFVNKIDPKDAASVKDIIVKKLNLIGVINAEVFTLPYVEKEFISSLKNHESITKAKEFVSLKLANAAKTDDEISASLRAYWPNWTLDLQTELAAVKDWRQLLGAEISKAKEIYVRDYLDTAIYSDTRQKTMLRLLELLEIPTFANTVGKLREIITWPVRILVKNLKHNASDKQNLKDIEQAILEELYENLSARLTREMGEQSANQDTNWWQELWQVSRIKESELKTLFNKMVENYQKEFTPEIQNAANAIYKKLKTQPATLNSLRAARASVDAAAVFFALKTAGVGLNDLLLTPAMLAFTSMVAESAVGHFLRREEEKLKAKQKAAVFELMDQLSKELQNLPKTIDQQKIFGISQKDFEKISKMLGRSQLTAQQKTGN